MKANHKVHCDTLIILDIIIWFYIEIKAYSNQVKYYKIYCIMSLVNIKA